MKNRDHETAAIEHIKCSELSENLPCCRHLISEKLCNEESDICHSVDGDDSADVIGFLSLNNDEQTDRTTAARLVLK